MKISDIPVTHFDPVKNEMSELEKRIEQEAGPVKTYQAIEWFSPSRGVRGRNTRPALHVNKDHVIINRPMRKALGDSSKIKVGWSNLDNALVIQPAGPDDGFKHNNGRFGGRLLADRIKECGFEQGVHVAEIDGKRVLIKPRKQVKS